MSFTASRHNNNQPSLSSASKLPSHRVASAAASKQPRQNQVSQPVLNEQAKQVQKMARNEIEELRESLRYAEYLLQRTR